MRYVSSMTLKGLLKRNEIRLKTKLILDNDGTECMRTKDKVIDLGIHNGGIMRVSFRRIQSYPLCASKKS